MATNPSDYPKTFVEMLTRSSEHMGTLEVGRFAVVRNEIRAYVYTQTGDPAVELAIPAAYLTEDDQRLLWELEARLARYVGTELNKHMTEQLAATIGYQMALKGDD